MDISRFRVPTIWIASIVGLFTFLHLIGVYIYEGGSVLGVPGGSINIGLVGKSPEIPNPMNYGQNKQHDLILSFLFRSVLRYNTELSVYEGDLGTCDLADLSRVNCILSGSGEWSDGTQIQVADVVATYEAWRESTENEKMKAFLRGVKIVSKNKTTIEISANEKNSLMLDLLTAPILRSDMIERIRTDRLGKDGYVTSGAYVFVENEKNTQYGYDKVTIGRNEKNNAIGWLDKYNFLFFPDDASLERSADILSVIVPDAPYANMLLGPRYVPYEYATYEYIGLFLNTDNIGTSVRKNIILQAQAVLSGSVAKNERAVPVLFPPSENTQIKLEKNLSDIMREGGYRKVEESLALLENETGLLTGSSIVYDKSIYFDTPSRDKVIWSEVADGVITLAGNVPTGVKSVIINGYTLQEFSPGNNRFTYKVSLANGTLKKGENTYVLEFESLAGVRTERDRITLGYYRDTEELSRAKKALEDSYLAKLNTPEAVAKRKAAIEEKKVALKGLNPRFYYNNKNESFSLKLVYITDPTSLENYAKAVSTALIGIGIETTIEVMSTKDFSAMLQKGEKNYDMLIIGFEANGRFSRIGQIFASSEATKGINFAKIESKTLDGLFANLRVSYIPEKTKEITGKIGDMMQSEAFFLPISSPLHVFYIDRSLKGVRQIQTFQDITTLYRVLEKVSIKEQYVLDTSEKGVSDFFSWLFRKARFSH